MSANESVRLTWWRKDHYQELSALLEAEGMAGLTRMMIAVIAAGLSLLALATFWSVPGPQTPIEFGFAIASSIGAAGCALIWALTWPSRSLALLFSILATTSIALVALAQHDPVIGMFTCTVFAMMASYISLFHTLPLIIYNFAVATVTSAVAGFRSAEVDGIVGPLCGYLVVLLLNLVVPAGIQVVVHLLGGGAVLAGRDQLTGLLTRRAFHRLAQARLMQGREQRAFLVVTVIDLDRFKQLNDNYGHSTGDDALVAVSRALRDTTDETAVIGRSGGEEFVIADIWPPDEVDRRAQRLCEEIAALSFGITASIGTAGIHPAYRTGSLSDLLVELIAAADAAMYRAKRRGGNQAGHHEWPLPPPLTGLTDSDTEYRSGGISA